MMSKVVYILSVIFHSFLQILTTGVYKCGVCWCELGSNKIISCDNPTSTMLPSATNTMTTTAAISIVDSATEAITISAIIWIIFEVTLMVLQYFNVHWIPGFQLHGQRILFSTLLSPTTVIYLLVIYCIHRVRQIELRQRELVLFVRDRQQIQVPEEHETIM